MDKIVAANFKMNLTKDEIVTYLKEINGYVKGKNIIFCPTSVYAPYFLEKGYEVGLQNISSKEKGAYTGEISARQASSMGIHYTIVGHSERRMYQGETDDEIHSKIKTSIQNGLKVILCIGESLIEREKQVTNKKIKEQIQKDLVGFEKEELSHIILAYEPIWAIGTGKVPTQSEISSTISMIKETVNELYLTEIPVLYGGSVSGENAESIIKIKEVDGFLVGGASLDAKKFLTIVKVAVTM